MDNKSLSAEFCISAKCNAAEIVILHEQLIFYIEIAGILRQSLGLAECGIVSHHPTRIKGEGRCFAHPDSRCQAGDVCVLSGGHVGA